MVHWMLMLEANLTLYQNLIGNQVAPNISLSTEEVMVFPLKDSPSGVAINTLLPTITSTTHKFSRCVAYKFVIFCSCLLFQYFGFKTTALNFCTKVYRGHGSKRVFTEQTRVTHVKSWRLKSHTHTLIVIN